MQVTICGGGNAAHTLAGLLAAREDVRVHLYLPYADEADRWRRGLDAEDGITVFSPERVIVGKPYRVSADPTEVVPGSTLVLLALPAFVHEIILRQIAGSLEDGVWVGALPARGGFDLCARDILKSLPISVSIFGLQTLPWACRIQEFGRSVQILGTKSRIDLATWPVQQAGKIATLLGNLLGVRLQPIANFLSLALADTGQIIHPGVMYGLFHNWDGQPYTRAPLFYQGVDNATAKILQGLSDEIQLIKTTLESRFSDLDLSAVRQLQDWLLRSYRDDIADPSSLKSCLVTNRSYAGLPAPMRPAKGRLVPDFQARYLAEDVPYNLIFARGISELVGCVTPTTDEVIQWAQLVLDKEYLLDNQLQGIDLVTSRAPQRFGYSRIEQLITEMYR